MALKERIQDGEAKRGKARKDVEERLRFLRERGVDRKSMLVAIDEAGSTPGNLLDQNQPLMVLSGVAVSNEVAREIIKTFYPDRHEELHHTKMYGSVEHNENLIAIHELCLSELNAVSYVIPKRMACCESFVLDCVVKDPVLDDFIGSPDYYNLIWHMNKVYDTDQKVSGLLRAYVRAVSGKKGSFEMLMTQIRGQTDCVLTDCLDGSILAEMSIERAIQEKTPHGLIDGMFMELLEWYGERFATTFDVVYDDSHQLDLLRGPLMEQASKAKDVQWCSRVRNIHPARSAENYAIQLADVVAGGVLQKELAKDCKRVCEDINKSAYIAAMSNLYEGKRGRILYKYEDALRQVGNPDTFKVAKFWLG